MPADPDLPDSVFVDDTAVIPDEGAVLAWPGDKGPSISRLRQRETLWISDGIRSLEDGPAACSEVP